MTVNDGDDCRLGFRDEHLKMFYVYGKSHKSIPPSISSALARKLDILNSATNLSECKNPPGNRFKQLKSPLNECYSIRVNDQYRLIFKWNGGVAELYLDPHKDV